MRNRAYRIELVVAALAGAALLGAAAEAAAASPWPQWRGPQRDAYLPDGATLPDSLQSLSPRWRVPLGPSYSGPVLSETHVFVTETHDEQEEIVRAIDRKTGEETWRQSWKGAISVPFFAKRNGDWIRATPAFDGESLFVAGIRDVLVCLNAKTGDIRWKNDFVKLFNAPVPDFGFVSSPLVDGNFVYVQAGGSFVKVDKRNGDVVWRALVDGGGTMGSAFSSPVFAAIHGRRMVIVQTREELTGVDPESGEVLWRTVVPSFRGMNILTPVVYGNGFFTSTYKNKSFFYEIEKTGSTFEAVQKWTQRGKGYMSSPIVSGDFVYMHLGNGRLTCLDLRSGEQQWRSQSFGQYMSMVTDGERILGLDETGDLVVFRASPDSFQLLDKKSIADQETWAHLAIDGDDVFVRELNAIAAWQFKGDKTGASADASSK